MKHVMEMKTKDLGVERGGIDFVVKGDNVTIGTLSVSKGRIKWYPRGAKKRCAEYTWEQFDEKVKDDVKAK